LALSIQVSEYLSIYLAAGVCVLVCVCVFNTLRQIDCPAPNRCWAWDLRKVFLPPISQRWCSQKVSYLKIHSFLKL